ncbi:hypothetical protein ACP4OV_012620 [Aristida adscensionis]
MSGSFGCAMCSPHPSLRSRRLASLRPRRPPLSPIYQRTHRIASCKHTRTHSTDEPHRARALAMAALGAVAVCATAAAAAVVALTTSRDDGGDSAEVVVATSSSSSSAAAQECAVCLLELATGPERREAEEPAVRRLPACGHGFHAECIGRWLPVRPECPLCRRPVVLADDGRPAAARATAAAPAWARPARIACGFGDGRVVWTRSPSAQL